MKSVPPFVIIGVLAFVLSYFAQASPTSKPQANLLSPEALIALSDGLPVVFVWYDKSRANKALDVFAAIDIDAAPETIWRVMTDCSYAKKIVADMTYCKVLETAADGSWDIRKQKVKVGFLLPKGISIFRSDYDKPHTIKISLVGGNMKILEGVWELSPLPNSKTRVTYSALSLPKFPVPKGLLKRAVRHDVPVILTNLRMQSQREQGLVMPVNPSEVIP